MKINKKIMTSFLGVLGSASIIVPITTLSSCGKSVLYTCTWNRVDPPTIDIPQYEPKPGEPMLTEEQALEKYFEAISKHPQLIAQDFKLYLLDVEPLPDDEQGHFETKITKIDVNKKTLSLSASWISWFNMTKPVTTTVYTKTDVDFEDLRFKIEKINDQGKEMFRLTANPNWDEKWQAHHCIDENHATYRDLNENFWNKDIVIDKDKDQSIMESLIHWNLNYFNKLF